VTTEEVLNGLTDCGLFEKLATAVLRAADPNYQRLIHIGINAYGKTIPSSVDALVPPAAAAKIVFAAYTTTRRRSLRDKWFNPVTGDVPDTIARIQAFRRANASQAAILVLCTNRTPDERLLCDVGAACLAARVELDIWDRSRIAAFLDHNPTGQWLRQDLQGIAATQLSAELLRSLGSRSLALYAANNGSGRHCLMGAKRSSLLSCGSLGWFQLLWRILDESIRWHRRQLPVHGGTARAVGDKHGCSSVCGCWALRELRPARLIHTVRTSSALARQR
jgi:hypothetical protein